MSVTMRQAGNEWLVEVNGQVVGRANTKAEAEMIAAQQRKKLKWVASWRFSPAQPS